MLFRSLKIIYQDLAQPSVKKVGIALGTVFGLSNTLLLPIKLLNERTKLLFQNNMERYKIKLNEIPEDIICEVPPEIGIPVIEKLTYIQDINISELYINLLAKASSENHEDKVHPYFINAISNLCPDEAVFIQNIKNSFKDKDSWYIPYQSIVLNEEIGKFRNSQILIAKYLIDKALLNSLTYMSKYPLYIDNLIALGFLEFIEDGELTDRDTFYQPIEEQYKSEIELIKKERETGERKLSIINKYFAITETGREFVRIIS